MLLSPGSGQQQYQAYLQLSKPSCTESFSFSLLAPEELAWLVLSAMPGIFNTSQVPDTVLHSEDANIKKTCYLLSKDLTASLKEVWQLTDDVGSNPGTVLLHVRGCGLIIGHSRCLLGIDYRVQSLPALYNSFLLQSTETSKSLTQIYIPQQYA